MNDVLATLGTLAARLAARPPATPVGVRAGAVVGTAAFLARVHAWRVLLRRPGSHYALYLQDSIEFGAALLGAWQAGKVIWLAADTLDATCATLRDRVDGFLGDFPAACMPLQPGGDAAGDSAMHELAPDMDALVVFTSGSTGAPQAIPKKLRQLGSEVATLEALFGARAGDGDVIATVSHQHIYGLLFKVLWPLAAGRAIHAAGIATPRTLSRLLAARPCVLVASPAHLSRLPASVDWRGARLQLRAVFSSGGPLPVEAAQDCGALLGTVPVEVFGSSETGGIAWRQRSAAQAFRDEAWTPFPTVAWRIDGGLLAVRSPHLPDDGWLRLSDRAEPAGVQGFVLRGRDDRIVKIAEKRISLDAMEAALLATGLVRAARVLPCEAGPGRRQMLAAIAVPTEAGRMLLKDEGSAALDARLRRALAMVVDRVALPRRWRYVDRLPADTQGKTTRAALLALLEAGNR